MIYKTYFFKKKELTDVFFGFWVYFSTLTQSGSWPQLSRQK